MKNPDIILASSSPFRQQLLQKLGLSFQAVSPNIDEQPCPGERPETIASRLALDKAQALAQRFPDHLIIGSDQVAMFGEQQLEKPGDRAEAIRQLTLVAGKQAHFYTAVTLLESRTNRALSEVDHTIVTFRSLTRAQIERYVARDEPYQCAGGFKSEGLGIALFERIEGEDPNALVGLPLIRLTRMLEQFAVDVL